MDVENSADKASEKNKLMSLDARQKGNIAESELATCLHKFAPSVTAVIKIENQQDDSHNDLLFSIENGEYQARGQVKYLGETRANLKLKTRHFQNWRKAANPTFIFWWDEKSNKCYWSDPLEILLRFERGQERGDTITCRFEDDLNPLEPNNERQKTVFIERVKSLCQVWAEVKGISTALGMVRPYFPINFQQVISDPHIVRYLPFETQIRQLIEQTLPTDTTISVRKIDDYILDTLLAIPISPLEEDISKLVHSLYSNLGVKNENIDDIAELFTQWRRRSTLQDSEALLGYRGALDFLSQNSASIKAPIKYHHAWPTAKILKLLSRELIIETALRNLSVKTDIWSIVHSLYFLRTFSSEPQLDLAREIQHILSYQQSKFKLSADNTKLLHFQSLYSYASLGDLKYGRELVCLLDTEALLQNALRFNWNYYSRDAMTILSAYKRRMSSSETNEKHLTRVHTIIYDGLVGE